MAVKWKNTSSSETSLAIIPTPASASNHRTTPVDTSAPFVPSGGAPPDHSC
jgi:hypothetical protein